MRIHPVIQQQAGIISITMTATFVGDPNDVTDKQRIAAYGDPPINLAGLFTDPNNTSFSFTFPTLELYAGLTTQMASYTARFMTTLPVATMPGVAAPQQGQLDCLTSNPIQAATVWVAAIEAAALAAMTTLRALTPAQLTTLPDATI